MIPMTQSPAASTDSPIVLDHVTRRFGRATVVDDLSFSVPRGTTMGFIGLNGAGKTTTIRMMVGLLRPNSGCIRVADCEVPKERDRLKPLIGYVPDRPTVYAWMRVEQAIEFARSFYQRWNNHRCNELVKIFDLDRGKRVKHLSKGQAAKLSLLLALCHEPQVLVLDEPTSGFDPLVREEFLEGVLAVTSEREQTVLFSSHTLADVQRLADSVAILHEGKLVLHSSVDALLEHTKRIRAVLEDESEVRQPPPGLVFQQIRGREWLMTVENFAAENVQFIREKNRVSQVDVLDMSLDDVFKDVIRAKKEAV
jgi:ABC-2 type transport system ATP-binding protein